MTTEHLYTGKFPSQPPHVGGEKQTYTKDVELRIHTSYTDSDERYLSTEDCVYVQFLEGKPGNWNIVQIAVPLDQIEEIVVALQFAALHAQKKGDIS